MAKKAKPVVFDVPLFGGEIVLCRNLAEWRYAMKHYRVTDEDDPPGTGRFCELTNTKDGTSAYVIGILGGDVATLAHECAHAVFAICGRAGVDVEEGRKNETFCYLMGTMMRGMLREFRAPRRK